ncbi:beta-hexosaminidase 2-like [Bidens hawaiensis]|uniref:beta-hexosaminidase 2-like n=1 Tax=Bidens hawaiensis TaxID=980011 RepID=UPI00404912F9
MIFHILFISLLTLLISTVGSPMNIWPTPRSLTWTSPHAILLSTSFTINSPSHRYLTPAVNRYLRQILTTHYTPLLPPTLNLTVTPPLQTLTISVDDVTAPLSPSVNESYTLTVTSHSATMTSATVWGAMRGLETFSQLIWGDPTRIASGLVVTDWPVFEHRGVMLDTGRNYYPVEDLIRLIGSMSANKLNVFHWHLTDSQSFPLVLESEPGLAGNGSYGSGMEYSREDVERVVEFGLEHGVRIVPEIDMPGHTGSWAEAYPDIVTCANMFWWPAGAAWEDRLASEPGTGHLNPLIPKTYDVVKNVVKETTTLFPDSFYHAGADETVPSCWKADPTIQAYLANNGTLSQVLEIFINNTNPYIVSLNRTTVYWEDVILDAGIKVNPLTLPPETTIMQTWNAGPDNTKRLVSAGYRTIVSSSDFYYLDCGHGDFTGNNSAYDQPPGFDQKKGGSWCGPFKTWQLIYNYDITYGLNETEAKLVLGGEVALWSEQADPTVLDSRMWPRASAMAESLWSGNRDETGKKRSADATDRLSEWIHRMVSRGVKAEPIQPLWCIKNPGMCNTANPIF